MKDLNTFFNLLLKDKTEMISIQFFRYFFVGAMAFLVDLGSLYILTSYLNIYYLYSAAFAFFLGLITNYFISIQWVFNKRKLESQIKEFHIFAFIGIVGLLLNEFFIWLFTDYFLVFYLNSKILSALFVLIWNFFVRKYTLF